MVLENTSKRMMKQFLNTLIVKWKIVLLAQLKIYGANLKLTDKNRKTALGHAKDYRQEAIKEPINNEKRKNKKACSTAFLEIAQATKRTATQCFGKCFGSK